MNFRDVIKYCKECGKKLHLKCTRDIQRKNYCSYSCRSINLKFLHNIDRELLVKLANTPEANAKKGLSKEKNPRWLKDRTKLKTRVRFEQYEWKKQVLERDNYTCRCCGTYGGKLQVHHKAPYKNFPSLRWVISNGLTVCLKCHKEIHSSFAELFGGLQNKKVNYAL